MISIISIFLDLGVNNYIKKESLFLSLFTLLSIMFIKRDNKYLLKVFLLGILYDLLFTNYYLLDGFIFLFLGLFILFYYKKLDYNLINNIILGLILIILYQLILYIVFNVTKINILNLEEFIFIIKHFIIINIIYIVLFSLILKKERFIN